LSDIIKTAFPNFNLNQRVKPLCGSERDSVGILSFENCDRQDLHRLSLFIFKSPPQMHFPPNVVQDKWNVVPEGIITHLTRQCGANVHDAGVVEVSSSKPMRFDPPDWSDGDEWGPNPENCGKNVADLKGTTTRSRFSSRGLWICYDFKSKRIVPTHYAINLHTLTNWVVETSLDGVRWREADRQHNFTPKNSKRAVRPFTVSGSEVCRFIRIVSQDKKEEAHVIAWEIYGSLIE
jgi:hypothetical protein